MKWFLWFIKVLFSHGSSVDLGMAVSLWHLVGLPLWFRLKYLNSYWMYCHAAFIRTILVPRGWILFTLVIPWLFIKHRHDVDIFVTKWNGSITFRWIAMKFATDIHGPQRLNSIRLGDPLTFHLAPALGQTYPGTFLEMAQKSCTNIIPAKYQHVSTVIVSTLASWP